MMRKIILLLVCVMTLVACSGGQKSNNEGKLDVVATVGMLADVVQEVGGERVEVKALMGPGVDPHLYQPSAGDIGKLENADVVFYVGLHLEGKMVEIFESLALKKDVFAAAGGLDKSKLLDPQEGQTGNYDPHVWFDVALWANTVDVVKDILVRKDPAGAALYLANAEAYKAELVALDKWVSEQVNLLGEDQRVLITAHDAFGYFGESYGMEVHGIQGISTASDYGLKDLQQLIDFIVEREIKAVFVESSVPRKSIEALQEGVRAKGWDLLIGGELFSDAMGEAGTEEGTYVGMVRHNVETIVNALK